MKVVTLHILEHPFLHGKPASDPPVHVIWEPHEFDYWHVSEKGDLYIGRRETYMRLDNGEQAIRQAIKVIIQHGMYAKVWEEAEEYPDPVASVSSVEPIYTDPLFGENGPELAPWQDESLTDTGEHDEPLIARADLTHLDPQPEPEVRVEVVRVDEPGDDQREVYTDKTVISAEPITPDGLDLMRIPPKQRHIVELPTHIEVKGNDNEPFDSTEMGVDGHPKPRPGYGWPSGSYRQLADPTTEFKIPKGNTFFDEGDLPEVPEVFGKDGRLAPLFHPYAPDPLNQTRIDLPRFLSPDPADDAVAVEAERKDNAPKE